MKIVRLTICDNPYRNSILKPEIALNLTLRKALAPTTIGLPFAGGWARGRTHLSVHRKAEKGFELP
jgi:hypothetical protein